MDTITIDPVHQMHPDSPLALMRSWEWREPRYGEYFRTCSYCGSIHPADLAPGLVAAGECRVCGRQGWDACFRSQKPSWFADMTEQERRELDGSRPGALAEMEARTDSHHYDPGAAWASWADRKYGWPHKFYVHNLAPRDPARLYCTGHSSGPREEPDWGLNRSWVKAADLTEDQKLIVRGSGMARGDEFTGAYLFQPRTTLFAKFYSVHLADPEVSDEVKEKIFLASGLRFIFRDGKVSWHALDCGCSVHEAAPEVTGTTEGM